MKLSFACFIMVFLWSCSGLNDVKQVELGKTPTALSKKVNSNTFNVAFNNLLNAYFSLKEQFIAEKDSGIAQKGRLLILAADSLPLNELKGDTNLIITAKTYSEGISAEMVGLLGETNLLAKRRSFQMVSDQLYDLIITVQYDQAVLFHYYCSSSFDYQGAYWISQHSDGKNPYDPNLTSPCAQINDTLNFGNTQ